MIERIDRVADLVVACSQADPEAYKQRKEELKVYESVRWRPTGAQESIVDAIV
jgi:hypothetical protein